MMLNALVTSVIWISALIVERVHTTAVTMKMQVVDVVTLVHRARRRALAMAARNVQVRSVNYQQHVLSP